uniref:Endonuclease/exonuclease/phosphatase domain-containing protein n=1 Tax=viral metagenome TaxID=1070528 RepID=A0A6C0JT27_9ZZZZ
MNAYDLSNILSILQMNLIDTLVIGSFNVMSNYSSNYSLPDKSGYVRGPEAGEKPNDWKKRYQMSLKMLSTKYFDVLCLQEATPDFYHLVQNEDNGKDSDVRRWIMNYYIVYDDKQGLMTLVNKEIVNESPRKILPFKTKFNKTMGCILQLVNGMKISIVNIHLTGDPNKTDERTEILKNLADKETIIVGDFNQSTDEIYDFDNFKEFLSSSHFNLENIGSVSTSYSRYVVDNMGYVKTTKEDASWTNVDNIMYDRDRFSIVGKMVFPKGGLYGKDVPYLRVNDTFTRNFITWTSDHTLNVFTVLLFKTL